jgi:hypothetical protein
MVLFMVPAAGLFLYLIFSQNIARQQIFRMTEEESAGNAFIYDRNVTADLEF